MIESNVTSSEAQNGEWICVSGDCEDWSWTYFRGSRIGAVTNYYRICRCDKKEFEARFGSLFGRVMTNGQDHKSVE